MKKIVKYALLWATAGLVACAESPMEESADKAGVSGSISFTIGTRATESEQYDPMSKFVLRIFDDADKLIRKYTSHEVLPERLELLSGDYSVSVEAGEKHPATTDKLYYIGNKEFSVIPAQTTAVEVLCKRQNVATSVQFQDNIAENFGSNFRVWIGLGGQINEALGEEDGVLSFTSNGKGYFLLPEGVTSLAWKFAGEHISRGEVVKEGTLENLIAGGNYAVAFGFSPDKPGLIEVFEIMVDDSTEDYNDTILWSGITIESSHYDLSRPLNYTPEKTGAITYQITNTSPITNIIVEVGGQQVDLMSGTLEGATLTPEANSNNYTLTLDNAFFTKGQVGNNSLNFIIRDQKNELEKRTTYRLPGLLPIAAGDYDLWQNTLTLRALNFDEESEVEFILQDGNNIQTLTGVKGANETYTATFTPQWVEGVNKSNQKQYTLDGKTGLFPNRAYTCKAAMSGKEYSTSLNPTVSQPIPYGDMENEGLSAYGTDNSNPAFWGSGNNSFTKTLCSQSTFAGMGGSHCTKLAAAKSLVLGSGNFFTGGFDFTLASQTGVVNFGMDYDWKARPTAIKYKYHATVGKVNMVKHPGAGIGMDDQDISTIYVAIVDWNERHPVSSGTSGCSGMFSVDATTQVSEGKIIGYGYHYINASTTGSSMVEHTLDIHYYDKTAKPQGKYKIIIAASTSHYGDYMVGCSSNVLYLDDFEWVF